jgi:hypothetical protein
LVLVVGDDGVPLKDPGAAGAVVSTVQEVEVRVAPTLPAASVWRTYAVCVPSARPLMTKVPLVPEKLVQAFHEPLSSLHWMVPPDSAVVKVRVAPVFLVGEEGTPLIAPGLDGAVKSTVHELDVPMALTLPTESVWRTEIVFAPAARALRL